MQFVAVSLLTSDLVDSFLEVAKINYQMLVMLTKVFRLQIFIFCIFKCAMCYVMYAKIVKQLHI